MALYRREFYDAWQSTKSAANKEAVDRIAVFYEIEAAARGKPADRELMPWRAKLSE